jgi:hypothetical protein
MFWRRHQQAVVELDDLRRRRERDLDHALSSAHRRLLEVLQQADRKPVSMRELEEAGIANPATVIYELEVAGSEIEHVYASGPSGHRRLAGFRLVPTREPSPQLDEPHRGAWLGALRGRDRHS